MLLNQSNQYLTQKRECTPVVSNVPGIETNVSVISRTPTNSNMSVETKTSNVASNFQMTIYLILFSAKKRIHLN